MDKTPILTIYVEISGNFPEMDMPDGHVTMIPFTGTADGEIFTGTIMPGGVDVQTTDAAGVRHMFARYMLDGTDYTGKPCKIYIENHGYFMRGQEPEVFETVPTMRTDNLALRDYLQGMHFRGEGHASSKGVNILIFDTDKKNSRAFNEKTKIIEAAQEPQTDKKDQDNDSNVVVPDPVTSRQEYQDKCMSIDYKSLARNLKKYEGEYVKFTGRVVQTIEEDNKSSLRVDVTKKSSDFYEDTVYVDYNIDDENRILEKDIVTIYGRSKGLYTYHTFWGKTITIPYVYRERGDPDPIYGSRVRKLSWAGSKPRSRCSLRRDRRRGQWVSTKCSATPRQERRGVLDAEYVELI